MRNLNQIEEFLRGLFGVEAASLFRANIEDFMYFVRSKALSDQDDVPRERLQNIVTSVLAESVKAYLAENYSSEEGDLQLNTDGSEVYDRDMNLIEPVRKLRNKHGRIIDVIIKMALDETRKGHVLARKIVRRYYVYHDKRRGEEPSPKDVVWDTKTSYHDRDYASRPAMENVEIEIMRMERRLPLITAEEGRRLAELYAYRGGKCAGKS